MTDAPFDALLEAYLEGEPAPEDLAALHEAVRSDPACRARFQAACRLHVLLREALAEQVELSGFNAVAQAGRIGPRPRRRRWAVAALAACLLGAALLGASRLRARWGIGATQVGVCLYVSGDGVTTITRGARRETATVRRPLYQGDRLHCDGPAQAMVRLNDGTLLSLEADSSLTLAATHLHLTRGQALFEVAPQPAGQAPFEVDTPQAEVRVHGTTFNLRAAGAATQLQVYEGTVTLTRRSDRATVAVAAEQMVDTGVAELRPVARPSPLPRRPVTVTGLVPTDAACLDAGRRHTQVLRVEGGRRTTYLRFEIPAGGIILHARLRLTQTVDPGSGTLTFARGSHADWSERTLTAANAPVAGEPSVTWSGVVQPRQTVEVDVSPLIAGPGPLTIVVDLDQGDAHDIWFHGRGSDLPPQLSLTTRTSP